jgi:hemerythrin
MRADWRAVGAPKAIAAFHTRICDFLHHWLIDHILQDDLLMMPFIAEMRPARQRGQNVG